MTILRRHAPAIAIGLLLGMTLGSHFHFPDSAILRRLDAEWSLRSSPAPSPPPLPPLPSPTPSASAQLLAPSPSAATQSAIEQRREVDYAAHAAAAEGCGNHCVAETDIVVMVLSVLGRGGYRDAIRETSLANLDPRRVRLVFVLGRVPEMHRFQKQELDEEREREDFLYLDDFEESYAALTNKILVGMRAIHQRFRYKVLIKVCTCCQLALALANTSCLVLSRPMTIATSPSTKSTIVSYR
jgi:hypothetical protein